MGGLEASRDMETEQEASRAVPVPGPMVEQTKDGHERRGHKGHGDTGLTDVFNL